MLNKTSSFYKPKLIDFKVMGFDNTTNDYLNWCMEYRDNLEKIKEKNILDLKSASSILYFNELKIIKRIDRNFTDNM